MDVMRLTGVLGAEVSGIDLSSPLPADAVGQLVAALDEHLVVFVRDQRLDPDQQVTFSHRLGPYSPVPFVEPMEGHPEVIAVVKEADEGASFNFGGAWHSDFSFLPEPPSYTILHAVEVPPWGGDTVWASMVAAFEQLPGDLRDAVAEVDAVHTAKDAYSPKMQPLHDGLRNMSIRTNDDALQATRHPLLCTHPGNDRTVLFFNQAYVRGLVGRDGEDVAAERDVLDRLHRHSTDHRFTCRWRWRAGDVAIWDNRATQHLALNDYAGHRRELRRTTVRGSTPVHAG